MRELLNISERGKRAAVACTVGILGIIGVGGCAGDTETVSWALDANCPEESAPEIRNTSTRGSLGFVEIVCNDGSVPTSVEIVEGPVSGKLDTLDHNLEVSFGNRSGFFGKDAVIENITMNEERARIVFNGVSNGFSRTAVVEPEQ